MDSKHNIRAFAEKGREHLNAAQRLRAGLWALLIFGAVALAVELVFVLSGHRVARWILLLPLAVAVVVAIVAYLRFRFCHRRAIGHIDDFFDLKDGLVTADEHIRKGRSDEIHTLQLKHTARAIEPHDPVALRPALSRRLQVWATALIIASVALLFVDDSLAVQQARAEEKTVLELSEAVAQDLEEAFEEIMEEPDEEVAKLLQDPELNKLMSEFQADTDRRAVMRKLSEMDRHLAQKQAELDTRADENYLMALAENLQESKETVALGNALAKRNYRKAAEELKAMELSETATAEERKALEQLSARVGETEKSMASSESGARRDAQEMSEQIQKMAQEQRQSGQCSKECKSSTNQSINKNSNSMKQLGARKDAQSALEKLRQKLQDSQSNMGQGNKPGQGQKPSDGKGGNEAGEGVDRSVRTPEFETSGASNLENLSGQIGEGESEKRIEDAASGSGTASESGDENGQVGYERQVEAFVRREDIPEEMKHGVKTYFKNIQKLENEQREGVE
jgi:hypothetical protein